MKGAGFGAGMLRSKKSGVQKMSLNEYDPTIEDDFCLDSEPQAMEVATAEVRVELRDWLKTD